MDSILSIKIDAFKRYLDDASLIHKDYQLTGVRWTLTNELHSTPPYGVRGGFIADEMGLGKTIMMIGTCYTNPLQNTLIVLPPVLIDQWVDHIFKTTAIKPYVFHGKNKKNITHSQLYTHTFVITTYAAICLKKKENYNSTHHILFQKKWDRIIFDEGHHLRNPNTAANISANALKADIKWLISGTPIQNRKKDFYALSSVIGLPKKFYTDIHQIKTHANHFILKRTKEQVGLPLLPIVQNNNLVDWKNQSEMHLSKLIHSNLNFSNLDTFKPKHTYLYNNQSTHKIVHMIRAKQSCTFPKLLMQSIDKLPKSKRDLYAEAYQNSSKLDAITNSILEKKDNGNGKLIFCHYRLEIDELYNRLIKNGLKVATFDGRTPFIQRKEILTQKNDVLILQIQTGCEGLNLQSNFSEIYFVTPHWNPSIEDQAVARCHRFGQKKTVYVERFSMSHFQQNNYLELNDNDNDTPKKVSQNIDQYTNGVQNKKRKIVEEVLGNV